jgi:hypothetical protein
MKTTISDQIINPYKDTIDTFVAREEVLLAKIAGDPSQEVSIKLELVNLMLDLASHYILINNVFLFFHGAQREGSLNEARKALFKSLMYLEDLVTNWVDVAFTDLEEKLAALEGVSAVSRYRLIRKMGLAILLLEYACGENNKWKWSFVDLEGRHAAAVRNIIDIKNLVMNLDPRSPDYEPMVMHLRMVKKLLARAAKRYRERYELSTHLPEDFQRGINFLNALRRIHIILSERGEAEELKKTVDAWTAKLSQDSKTRQRSSLGKI